ncbi:MAG: glycosyltransferase family 2 protein [Fibrobacter sp.]|nr:glycosyltransferase family 2 protein [Fibrobacter sp.]
MNVQAVLVNFRNEAKTINCLRALERGTVKPRRVFVVDNSCTETSRAAFLKESFDLDVEWIWNVANLGFAAGCNQGIRRSMEETPDDYVWLLNNDTEPTPTALENLLKKAEQTGAGITGSAIYDSNGNFSGGVGLVHPKFASVKRGSLQQPERFDYIEGSSFLISPQCLAKIGPLSEDYFLYFEESDYCLKAKKAGLTLAWATDSVITHHIGSSTGSEIRKGGVPFFIDCLMIRNRIHFARSNGFPAYGIFVGLLISLGLRLKRGQFNRVVTILRIISSRNAFRNFIIKNGGFYDHV